MVEPPGYYRQSEMSILRTRLTSAFRENGT